MIFKKFSNLFPQFVTPFNISTLINLIFQTFQFPASEIPDISYNLIQHFNFHNQ